MDISPTRFVRDQCCAHIRVLRGGACLFQKLCQSEQASKIGIRNWEDQPRALSVRSNIHTGTSSSRHDLEPERLQWNTADPLSTNPWIWTSRPDQGCHGYRSSRTSVPWVFRRLVVQHRASAFITELKTPAHEATVWPRQNGPASTPASSRGSQTQHGGRSRGRNLWRLLLLRHYFAVTCYAARIFVCLKSLPLKRSGSPASVASA